MKITMCGSMIHIDAMKQAAQELTSMGYEVDTPNPRDGEIEYGVLSASERAAFKQCLIQEHLDKISQSDAVLIFNQDKNGVAGYIGGNTLMEMAFAYAQKIEVFLLNPAPEMGYTDEILGMRPIVLDGDVARIHDYFLSLPAVAVSGKSPIKHAAISRGMCRAGFRTRIVSVPTESNIAEQPMNINETYEGALNRQAALVEQGQNIAADYFATIESGQHPIHPQHNTFGSSVVIIEKRGGERKIGINVSIEYPKSMTDKVPSVYPDLGVLVQKEYGSKLKDPLPFFTNNKLNRLKTLEEAVFNVAVQLNE